MKKTIIITGASDGIGAAAARQLKKLGHNVVVIGRNRAKTENIANQLNSPYFVADFAKLSDVVQLADELSKYPRIDVLVNNAGAVLNERTVTEDGFEKTFQTNVLAAFLLTNLLLDKLCESNATVIQTSSIAANLFGRKLDLRDLQNERAYTPVKAYGESKLCNILFTRELNKRYHSRGISAVAFEPGIPRSNFASEGSLFFKTAYHSLLKYLFTTSLEKSAQRIVNLAQGVANKDFICGQTYSKNNPYKVRFRDNGEIANDLWNRCEEMVAGFEGNLNSKRESFVKTK